MAIFNRFLYVYQRVTRNNHKISRMDQPWLWGVSQQLDGFGKSHDEMNFQMDDDHPTMTGGTPMTLGKPPK